MWMTLSHVISIIMDASSHVDLPLYEQPYLVSHDMLLTLYLSVILNFDIYPNELEIKDLTYYSFLLYIKTYASIMVPTKDCI